MESKNNRKNMIDKPSKVDFLVSFLVDARGGSMTGSRKSGIRIVIPPQSAEQPVRITCRQLRPDQVLTLPPLSEGEGLACRILHLTPVTFLTPILLEVPHFATMSDTTREIMVLRSESGKKWSQHCNTTDNTSITSFLATNLSNKEQEDNNIITITTTKIPQYFAIISRPRQQTLAIGPAGSLLHSEVNEEVQCLFPPDSITKDICVGLSVFPMRTSMAREMSRQCGAVSPVVTLEPRRRKFHKAVSLTIPVPDTSNIDIETDILVLCSLSGPGCRTVWEEVTQSITLVSPTLVQLTTVVSAQFWCIRLPAWMAADKLVIADKIFRSAMRVPYRAHIWIFWREVELQEREEVDLRVVVVTDGERVIDNTLEERESFLHLYKSEEVAIVDASEVQVAVCGNMAATTESQTRMVFRPFMENRVTIRLVREEVTSPPTANIELVTDCQEALVSKPFLFNI